MTPHNAIVANITKIVATAVHITPNSEKQSLEQCPPVNQKVLHYFFQQNELINFIPNIMCTHVYGLDGGHLEVILHNFANNISSESSEEIICQCKLAHFITYLYRQATLYMISSQKIKRKVSVSRFKYFSQINIIISTLYNVYSYSS